MVRIAIFVALLLQITLLIGASSARADAMRCGNALATEGNTQEEVRAKCGEPASTETRNIMQRPSYWRDGRRIFFGRESVEVKVELWTYNLGPSQFMRRLKFIGGRLTEVETLGYGHL